MLDVPLAVTIGKGHYYETVHSVYSKYLYRSLWLIL